MKVSEQLGTMQRGFAVSPHTFMKQLSEGLQQHLQKRVPGLQVGISGKNVTGQIITLKVTGTAQNSENVGDQVRQIMNELRTPNELLNLLK